MGTRRSIPLYHVLTNPDYGADLVNEVIGLVLSLFMLIGVRRIGPIFIERKQSEERIKLLLTEKETLLRELYHRTKNTMQVIRGLIVLQAAEFSTNTDIQQLVKNTENRIQAISLVHQKLYKSQDLSHICIREYITELSALIVQSYSISGDRISLDIAIDDQCFLLDTAIPLGLILNELMTNSLKHAFPDNRNGKISISFKEKDSRKNIFVYYDDGIGVPDGFDLKKQPTLGSKLISSIVETTAAGKHQHHLPERSTIYD